MKFDVVFVTYNSKKWLKGNLDSILKSNYDLKENVSLYYYDNKSTDDTVNYLYELKEKYGDKFANFKIIEGRKNKGFGYGNNKAVSAGNSEYVFILNTDTEIKVDTFKELERKINESKNDFSIFELRQEPYEHPKYYDPYSGEVSWASGACVVFKRKVFEKIGGFDNNLFMYCEDVEISWRARQRGYRIKYLYDVGIKHYSYSEAGEFKLNAFIYGYINNLYLRCKFGSLKNALKGLYLVSGAIVKNKASSVYDNDQYIKVSKLIRRALYKMIFKYIGARIYKHTHRSHNSFKPQFINLLDYEAIKINPFKEVKESKVNEDTKVSIIVRTCGRPNVLRETLVSLRNQTYKNFEVVIVEDGKNVSESMIKKEFSDLDIKYKATNNHVGRSKAGNIAMKMASGKYFNFLDDDDLFYPNHIEVLVTEAVKNDYDIVYDTAFETKIDVLSKTPYKYSIHNVSIVHSGLFTRLKLYKSNLFPIQTVMFKKEVFETCGGFDEKMDALEDWDLWIRFSLKYNFNYVKDTTSLYRVPLNITLSKERQEFIDSYLSYMIDKYKDVKIEVSFADIFLSNY